MSRRVNLLSVSGGKDSTAMLLFALGKGYKFQCVFADTGHEHEDTYTYLDYLETQLGVKIKRVKPDFSDEISRRREKIKTQWESEGVAPDVLKKALEVLQPTGNPFLDLCLWKGVFPSRIGRFCTEYLKTQPITNQVVLPILKSGQGVRSWQGVRADESARRATYPIHEKIDLGVWVYRPLLKWTAQDVFDMHRKHGIKPNPLYKKGMGRVGCMPCIMCRKSELAEISRRFPEVIERIKKWEALVSVVNKNGNATFFQVKRHQPQRVNFNDVDHKTDGIESAALWSRTERGGRQFNLFDEHEEVPSCSSHYGLCELEAGA